jgi:hypothetical protein
VPRPDRRDRVRLFLFHAPDFASGGGTNTGYPPEKVDCILS